MVYTRRKTATTKRPATKKVVKERPKFRKEIKYFLTYIGPPCHLRIAGIPEQKIKRNKAYEVVERVYKAFLGVEGYCVEKKEIRVEI